MKFRFSTYKDQADMKHEGAVTPSTPCTVRVEPHSPPQNRESLTLTSRVHPEPQHGHTVAGGAGMRLAAAGGYLRLGRPSQLSAAFRRPGGGQWRHLYTVRAEDELNTGRQGATTQPAGWESLTADTPRFIESITKSQATSI